MMLTLQGVTLPPAATAVYPMQKEEILALADPVDPM
jgi:hypothetical protein